MPNNSWTENDSDNEFDPISSLLSELSDPEEEEEEFKSDFFQGLEGRRKKAAFVLMAIWIVIISLHLVWWGYLAVASFTGLLCLQSIRLVFAKPQSSAKSELTQTNVELPFVSLLVAAKNEEAVIGNLVKMLCDLDYPQNKYEVWMIDDRSTDNTPAILDKLTKEYTQLKVVHRTAGAGGGKSGALNQVLSMTKGQIIGVFDADAKVPKDMLRKVGSMFDDRAIGAVQVRKAIANAPLNFWTKGQSAEMALDSYFQQQRIAIGGIGELRGNGQFVRREALERCGGWNEETITDDLDLTIRLHLDNWQIGFLLFPAVEEEGVKSAIALWHQRNRWAEGGYQRYLDYWRLLVSNRLSLNKKIDLFSFILIQYLLPAAVVPDLLMAINRHHLPVLSPMTSLMFSLSFWGMFSGLRRTQSDRKLNFATLFAFSWQSLRGIIYMLHWSIVIPSTTARMSVRPKRLKWVKTVHEGTEFANS